MKQYFPIERFRGVSTPFYYYDIGLLRRTLATIEEYKPAGSVVHYALKANSNPVLLSVIARAGLGADCVSGGEIERAMTAGFPADRIVYSGVGKRDDEIVMSLQQGIACFNVESMAELQVIDYLAGKCGKTAPVALRINPHIDAHTHHYITTGLSENKFGIDISLVHSIIQEIKKLHNIRLRGLHFHIGSQILTREPYRLLCVTINHLQRELTAQGIALDYINVGGGLGVDYNAPDEHSIPRFAAYFDTFKQHLHVMPGTTLHFELGRSIVCQCGSLVSRVLYVKDGLDKQFIIVDAGMTELIRPALYQASHKIENITSEREARHYDVVGPVCETADTFGVNISLPETHRGDFIVIRSAGAYAESMSMQYNSRRQAGSMFSEEID